MVEDKHTGDLAAVAKPIKRIPILDFDRRRRLERHEHFVPADIATEVDEADGHRSSGRELYITGHPLSPRVSWASQQFLRV